MTDDRDYDWDPRIYAAYASSRDRFCFVLSELEYDDPFTAIIEYDGQFAQPWSRTDVPREICAVVGLDGMAGWRGRYAALSNEGDVYVLDDPTITDKIIGAGVLSPDAGGAGALFDLARLGDILWAVGSSGQVFTRSSSNPWNGLPFVIAPTSGFGQADLGYLDGSNNDDVYICGLLKPTPISIDKATESLLMSSNASQKDWDDAYAAVERDTPNFRSSNEGRLFHWDGLSVREIDIPVLHTTTLRCVFSETRDRVWIAGTEGLLLKGNADDGFRRVADFGEDQRLASVTKFHDDYVVATQDTLYRFDGASFTSFKPPVSKRPIRPRKVQVVDDVLFYFDYREGVFRFDGAIWEQIEIPKELYSREFKGLMLR